MEESYVCFDLETARLPYSALCPVHVIGWKTDEDSEVHQVVLDDSDGKEALAHEKAALIHFNRVLEQKDFIITWHGWCFDFPVLRWRFLVHKIPSVAVTLDKEPPEFMAFPRYVDIASLINIGNFNKYEWDKPSQKPIVHEEDFAKTLGFEIPPHDKNLEDRQARNKTEVLFLEECWKRLKTCFPYSYNRLIANMKKEKAYKK